MTIIQSRHDTAANWTTNNPILAEGEIGVDTTNNIIKIGNGTTAWNSLDYPKTMTEMNLYEYSSSATISKISYPADSTETLHSLLRKQDILSAGDGLLSGQLSEIEPLNNNFTVTTNMTSIFNQSNFWAGLRVVVQIPVSESGYTIIGRSYGIYVEVRSDSFKIGYGTGTTQYNLSTINNAPGDYVQLTINYYNQGYVPSVAYYTQSGYGGSVSINTVFNYTGDGYILGTSGVTISYIKLYKFNALAVDTSIIPTLSGTNNFTGTLQYSGTEVAKADASNFTSAGTTTLSSYGMPSSRYVNLTLGDSGTTYTAPANGWYYFAKNKNSAAGTFGYIVISNTTSGITFNIGSTGGTPSSQLRGFVPALKGDVVVVSYNAAATSSNCRFIYAEGNPSS